MVSNLLFMRVVLRTLCLHHGGTHCRCDDALKWVHSGEKLWDQQRVQELAHLHQTFQVHQCIRYLYLHTGIGMPHGLIMGQPLFLHAFLVQAP